MTDSTQTIIQRKEKENKKKQKKKQQKKKTTKKQHSLTLQVDHNARQGPINTAIRQRIGQNVKKKKKKKKKKLLREATSEYRNCIEFHTDGWGGHSNYLYKSGLLHWVLTAVFGFRESFFFTQMYKKMDTKTIKKQQKLPKKQTKKKKKTKNKKTKTKKKKKKNIKKQQQHTDYHWKSCKILIHLTKRRLLRIALAIRIHWSYAKTHQIRESYWTQLKQK